MKKDLIDLGMRGRHASQDDRGTRGCRMQVRAPPTSRVHVPLDGLCAERAQTEGQRWRDNRRGRGRGRGRGDWHDRGGNWQAIGEEGEENEELNSRLYSSLTNPQDVPRKGYFFEVYRTIGSLNS